MKRTEINEKEAVDGHFLKNVSGFDLPLHFRFNFECFAARSKSIFKLIQRRHKSFVWNKQLNLHRLQSFFVRMFAIIFKYEQFTVRRISVFEATKRAYLYLPGNCFHWRMVYSRDVKLKNASISLSFTLSLFTICIPVELFRRRRWTTGLAQ